MQQVALKVNYRKQTGRTAVKQLRATGQVPGIVYGAHTQPVPVQIASKDLGKVLHSSVSENVLVELELVSGAKEEKRLALVQEVQHDALTDRVVHVDFHELKADEKFTTAAAVHSIGEAAGVKNGGVLEFAMRSLRVRCLPKDLPAQIVVDVTKLEIGQAVHVGEITPPAGVEFLDRKDLPVFTVVAPAVEEEVAPAEAAATEPEVIKEKKVEGEEAAAPEGKGAKAEKGAKGKAEAKPAAGKAEGKEAKTEAKPEAKKGK